MAFANDEKVKITVVGDSPCGKSNLIYSYVTNGGFPKSHDDLPSNYGPGSARVSTIGDRFATVTIFDTKGHTDYDGLRPLSYPNTDIFLICFSVVNRTSFENVKTRWLREVTQHCPNALLLLVGLKSDLRNDPEVLEKLRRQNVTSVTVDEANRLANEIGATNYLECSAIPSHIANRSIPRVFSEAVTIVMIDRYPQTANSNNNVSSNYCFLL